MARRMSEILEFLESTLAANVTPGVPLNGKNKTRIFTRIPEFDMRVARRKSVKKVK